MADYSQQYRKLYQNVSYFDEPSIRFAPKLVANILATQIPQVNIKGLAKGLKKSFEMVDQQNILAGVPGALSTQRYKATRIKDPGVRAQAFSVLDDLQKAAPDVQSQAISWLYGPGATDPNAAQAVHDLIYAARGQSAEVFATNPDGSQGDAPNYQAILPDVTGTGDVNLQAALKILFPAGGSLTEGVPLQDFEPTKWIDEKLAGVGSHFLDPMFSYWEGDKSYGSFLLDEVVGIPGGALKVLGAPFEAGGFLASNALRQVPGGTSVADATGSGIRWGMGKVGEGIHSVSTLALSTTGADPESDAYKRGQDALDSIMMLAALHYTGTGFKSIKVSRGFTPDAAAGELGIDLNPLLRPTRAILGSETLGKVISKPFQLAKLPDYLLSKSINELAQVGLEKWVAGKNGRALLGDIADAVSGDTPAAAMFRRYGNRIPMDLIDKLAAAEPLERPKILIDYMKGDAPIDAYDSLKTDYNKNQISQINVEQELQRQMTENGGIAEQSLWDRFHELRLEEKSLQSRMSDIATRAPEPLEAYPRRSVVRAAMLEPKTPFEKFLHVAMNPVPKVFDTYGFVDEVPGQPVLYDMSKSDAPLDGFMQNADILTKMFNRLKIDPGVARRWVQATEDISRRLQDGTATQQEWFEHTTAMSEDMAAHLPKNTPAWVKREIGRWHDNELEARTMSLVSEMKTTPDGVTTKRSSAVLEKVNEDGTPVPLPSEPSSFLSHVKLPPIDTWIEASSILRRGMRALKAKGFLGSAAADMLYYWPKEVLELSTRFMKPTILGSRMPAMAMRMQLEQAFRSAQYGYKPLRIAPEGASLFPGGMPISWSWLKKVLGAKGEGTVKVFGDLFGENGLPILGEDPLLRGITAPTTGDVGGILNQLRDDVQMQRHEENTSDFATGRRTPNNHHYNGWIDMMEKARSDWLLQKLARYNFDSARLLSDFKGSAFMQRYLKQQLELIKQSTLGRGGVEVTIPSADAIALAQFPQRADLNAEVVRGSRTQEQIDSLRQGAQEGTLAPPTVLYDPATGRAILTEGHHRLGATTETGAAEVKVNIETADLTDFEGTSAVPSSILGQHDGALVLKWLDRQRQHLLELTGNDPALLKAISDGFVQDATTQFPHLAESGRSVVDAYQNAVRDIEAITENLKQMDRTPENYEQIRALQMERKLKMEIADELAREHGAVVTDARRINLTDRKAMRQYLKDKWENNEVEMPNTVVTKRAMARRDPVTGDPIGTLDAFAAQYSNKVYGLFKPVSWADLHGTRGSLFYDIAERARKVYLDRGMSAEDAGAWAQLKAARVTKDIMYDLSARTSVQHALKDIFWFAPATQEILYTWLVKIPSQQYWPIGAPLLAAKTMTMIRLFKDMGIVKKNADGEDVIIVPHLNQLVSRLTGLPAPDIAMGKLSGLNLVASNPFPALSTVPAWALGRASRKYGGMFKELSDVLLPYGEEVSGVPQSVLYMWEYLTGNPLPISLSPGALKVQYDRAYDQGLQYAFNDLSANGIKPPMPEDFADGTDPQTGKPSLSAEAEQAYRDAATGYTSQLMSLGKDYLKGTALIKFIGSSVAPMSLSVTSKDREEWDAFWNALIAEKGPEGFNEEQRNMIASYLDQHPNSVAFNTFYSRYDDPNKSLPYESTGDEKVFDEYYTGQRKVMDPTEFANHLQIIDSYRHYSAQLNAALHKISPDLNPVELLLNGYKKMQAMANYHEDWERYKFLNPEAAGQLKDAQDEMKQYYGIPTQTFQANRLAETISNLQQISAFFTGETGVRLDDVKSVIGELKAAYSEAGTFGTPVTQTEKDLAWYYETIYIPYVERTAPLYDQANQIAQAGGNAGAIYNQIDAINAEYTAMNRKHGGQEYPTPQEVSFGNKTPGEQEAAGLHWATQPIYWLDGFKRDKVGYQGYPEQENFLAAWGGIEDQFDAQVVARGLRPGTTDYDNAVRAKDKAVKALAAQFGPDAQRDVLMSQAPPIIRLGVTGYGMDNQNWSNITQLANEVSTKLLNDGVSPSGYSEEAIFYKQWLFGIVAQARSQDPVFDKLWLKLSYSVPDKGYTQKEGSPLYDSILFGAYNTDFMPDSLTAIGG